MEDQFSTNLNELGEKSNKLAGEVKRVEDQFSTNLNELGEKSNKLAGEVKRVEDQFNENLKNAKATLSDNIQAVHDRLDDEIIGNTNSDDDLPRRPDISETLYSPMNLDTASGF